MPLSTRVVLGGKWLRGYGESIPGFSATTVKVVPVELSASISSLVFNQAVTVLRPVKVSAVPPRVWQSSPTSATLGVAYVHPSLGADNNSGDVESPFRTIAAAAAAGFNTLHLKTGSYSFPTVAKAMTYILYPGTTTVTNAPATVTHPISLIGYAEYPENRYTTRAASILTASGNPTSIFYVTGGFVTAKNLIFKSQDIGASPSSNNTAAFRTLNVSGEIHRCKNYYPYSQRQSGSPQFDDSFIVYAEATTSPMEWWVEECQGIRAPLFYGDSNTQQARYRFERCVTLGGGELGDGTNAPFFHTKGLNVGSIIRDNSTETKTLIDGFQSNCRGVTVFEGETRSLTFIGNGQERIGSGDHDYYFDNLSSSLVVHSKGPHGHFGDVRINGSAVGSTVFGDAKDNVVIIMPQHNPYG